VVSYRINKQAINTPGSTPSTLDDSVGPLVKFDPTFGAVPFGRARRNLGKSNALQVEPHIFALRKGQSHYKEIGRIRRTYILILAANHRAETHVPAEAVTWLTGINLLQYPIFIHADIL
jgi:hypothetical protein